MSVTEPKRPEFKLHKTPPLGKSGPYCVRKGKDGTISVHMGDYVILEGMNATDISNLASLMLSSCGMTQHDIQNQALENARAQWRDCHSWPIL